MLACSFAAVAVSSIFTFLAASTTKRRLPVSRAWFTEDKALAHRSISASSPSKTCKSPPEFCNVYSCWPSWWQTNGKHTNLLMLMLFILPQRLPSDLSLNMQCSLQMERHLQCTGLLECSGVLTLLIYRTTYLETCSCLFSSEHRSQCSRFCCRTALACIYADLQLSRKLIKQEWVN